MSSSSGIMLILPNRTNFRVNYPNAWAAGSMVRSQKTPQPFYMYYDLPSKKIKIFKIIDEKGAVTNASDYEDLKSKPAFRSLVAKAKNNTEMRRQQVKIGNLVRLKKKNTGWLSKVKKVTGVNRNKKVVSLSKKKTPTPISNIVIVKTDDKQLPIKKRPQSPTVNNDN